MEIHPEDQSAYLARHRRRVGLKREAIPRSARISAAAAVDDALRPRRPYKGPLRHEAAMRELVSKKAVHSCPALIDSFLSIETAIEKIYARLKVE